MLCACIDIGTNTTRLLVAEADGGGLRELHAEKAFTRIGRGLRMGGAISPQKLAEVCEVVEAQATAARALGCVAIHVVATAAIRGAANGVEFCEQVGEVAGHAPRMLSGAQEARLAFAGATRTLPQAPRGTVGVVDVGGGSCEMAVGSLHDGVTWLTSVPVGSGMLCERHLHGDPPSPRQFAALRADVAAAFAGLQPPSPEQAVAVGGSATSVRRLVGGVLDADGLRRAQDVLLGARAAVVGREHDLDPERVRLLPAGLELLSAASAVLGRPLEVARGGLREGVILQAMDEARA